MLNRHKWHTGTWTGLVQGRSSYSGEHAAVFDGADNLVALTGPAKCAVSKEDAALIAIAPELVEAVSEFFLEPNDALWTDSELRDEAWNARANNARQKIRAILDKLKP